MMYLYTNGCSMVFGKDLVPDMSMQDEDKITQDNWEKHRERQDKAWPGVLARRLSLASITGATCGGSMECIHRKTIVDLRGTTAPDSTLVIIGLTEPQRFEYWDDAGYHQLVLPRGSYKSQPRAISRFAEDTAWYKHRPVPTLESYCLHVIALQSYFKARGFKYLFVNSLDTYLDQADRVCPALTDQIDMDHVMPGPAMFTFCKQRGFAFGSTVHPLSDGHSAWANEVYKYATKVYPELVSAS